VENFVVEKGDPQISGRKKGSLVISDRNQNLHLKFSQYKVYKNTPSVNPTTSVIFN